MFLGWPYQLTYVPSDQFTPLTENASYNSYLQRELNYLVAQSDLSALTMRRRASQPWMAFGLRDLHFGEIKNDLWNVGGQNVPPFCFSYIQTALVN